MRLWHDIVHLGHGASVVALVLRVDILDGDAVSGASAGDAVDAGVGEDTGDVVLAALGRVDEEEVALVCGLLEFVVCLV